MWTNRLANEQSPYLLQHAHNPVDWLPWSNEAFELAKVKDKPIFLSIGYAACHWCHVMERESFSDPRVAAVLNTHFVPVKVDREERPGVDAIYIQALLAIDGSAGWPANLFLLPNLRPFAGFTYIPPQARHGMPSFLQVLERVRDAWVHHREAVEEAGSRLKALLEAPESAEAGGVLTPSDVRSAIGTLLRRADVGHGGFGSAPKFPQTPCLELLLLGEADDLPGAASHLSLTLGTMSERGLHDQVGGGFHRYCVDVAWTVPHFEKMLYDNAQLLRVYARSSAVRAATGDRAASLRQTGVLRDLVAWLFREMRDEQGTFWSSIDADDPKGEGVFYTFTAAEAREVLGTDSPLPFGITEEGNFENGRTVLHAREGQPSRPVVERLLEARIERARPQTDTKRVVAWNGLVIGALAEAGRLFGADEWVKAALCCAEAMWALRDSDGRLPRVLGSGAPSVLEDYAFLADGFLDLYQAVPDDSRWLNRSVALTKSAIEYFWDKRSGAFFESEDRIDLLLRRKSFHDGAEPSGNGRMADVLRRLGAYGAREIPEEHLERLLATATPTLRRDATGSPEVWGVLRARTVPRGPLELIVAGEPGDPRTQLLLRTWDRTWRPQGIVGVAPPGTLLGSRFSLFADRPPGPGGRPLAYVCRRGVCNLPVDTPEALEALLSGEG